MASNHRSKEQQQNYLQEPNVDALHLPHKLKFSGLAVYYVLFSPRTCTKLHLSYYLCN